MPSYLMERTTRRSATTKRMIQPVLPGSRSTRISSKRPVFHSAMKSRCRDSSIVAVAALGEDHGAQRVLRNAAHAAEFDGFDDVLEGVRLRASAAGLAVCNPGPVRRSRGLRSTLAPAVGNGSNGFFLRRRFEVDCCGLAGAAAGACVPAGAAARANSWASAGIDHSRLPPANAGIRA